MNKGTFQMVALAISGVGLYMAYDLWSAAKASGTAGLGASNTGQWVFDPQRGWWYMPATTGHPNWRSHKKHRQHASQAIDRESTFSPYSGYGGYVPPPAAPNANYQPASPFDTYDPYSYSPSAVDLETAGSFALLSSQIDAGYSG